MTTDMTTSALVMLSMPDLHNLAAHIWDSAREHPSEASCFCLAVVTLAWLEDHGYLTWDLI